MAKVEKNQLKPILILILLSVMIEKISKTLRIVLQVTKNMSQLMFCPILYL